MPVIPKTFDIPGLRQEALRAIPVDSSCRMDMDKLESAIVDDLDEIVRIAEKYQTNHRSRMRDFDELFGACAMNDQELAAKKR